jgi:hypothetical protein
VKTKLDIYKLIVYANKKIHKSPLDFIRAKRVWELMDETTRGDLRDIVGKAIGGRYSKIILLKAMNLIGPWLKI